jgi:hypothetical protein
MDIEMDSDVIATKDQDRALAIVATLSSAKLWFDMSFNEGVFYFELETDDFFSLVGDGTIELFAVNEHGGDE